MTDDKALERARLEAAVRAAQIESDEKAAQATEQIGMQRELAQRLGHHLHGFLQMALSDPKALADRTAALQAVLDMQQEAHLLNFENNRQSARLLDEQAQFIGMALHVSREQQRGIQVVGDKAALDALAAQGHPAAIDIAQGLSRQGASGQPARMVAVGDKQSRRRDRVEQLFRALPAEKQKKRGGAPEAIRVAWEGKAWRKTPSTGTIAADLVTLHGAGRINYRTD